MEREKDFQRARRIVAKYGMHATSFQTLEPHFELFFFSQKGKEGFVAYVETKWFRVVASQPIAPACLLLDLLEAFHQDAKKEKKEVTFFLSEQNFIEQIKYSGEKVDILEVGEQPEWFPQDYDTKTPRHKTLRYQVRRATRKGVKIRQLSGQELVEDEGPYHAEIEMVAEKWKNTRKMSLMSFLVELEPFRFGEDKTYFIAEQNHRAVAVLIAIPVFGRNGWFFEDILRVPNAPNGTVELLIDVAMNWAKEQGCDYVTLGLCPLANLSDSSKNHPWIHFGLKLAYKHLNSLYHFQGLYQFKKRFVPHLWQKQYLFSYKRKLGFFDLYAVLQVFSGQGILYFGFDTIKRIAAKLSYRQWSTVLFSLALLLIPWTLILAFADGAKWFGDTSIQYAWVAFDSLMVMALSGLGWLIRKKNENSHMLSLFLSGMTLTDFVLTTVQATHLHHGTRGWSAFFVFAGMMGPLLASIMLIVFTFTRPEK